LSINEEEIEKRGSRGCIKIKLTIWSPRFEVSARHEEGYVLLSTYPRSNAAILHNMGLP